MQLELDTACADVIVCAYPMSKIYANANACRHSQVVYACMCLCAVIYHVNGWYS